MAEPNKQNSPASDANPTPSPRSRSVTPGSNAFSRRHVRHPRIATPSSVQGRPFLTSPYLYSKDTLKSKVSSDTSPSPATMQAFQSDPAALWRKIAEQKKYLDEQLAAPSADDGLVGDDETLLDQTAGTGSDQALYERPITPEDKLDLLASPLPDVTPTHRMDLEREREEKLLKLIRSGGSTSPKTKIANIHESRGLPAAKPDLNKPVPPEPGSPKKRFLEKLGLGLGSTPPLKPANSVKGANADPIKPIPSPLRANVSIKAAKVLDTSVRESEKEKPSEQGNSPSGTEKSTSTLATVWPLTAHKTVASAQFFHNDFPPTPTILEQNIPALPSPPKSASTDAIPSQATEPSSQGEEGGVLLDTGATRTCTRVSPALSGIHSMTGTIENADRDSNFLTPATRQPEPEVGPVTAGLQQAGPGNSTSPATPFTNYDGYSPSIYAAHGSWYPPPGHPYAPASLYPTPLNIAQHYAYHPGYPIDHPHGSPMTLPPYPNSAHTSGNRMHPSYSLGSGNIGATLPDEMYQRLEPKFSKLDSELTELKHSCEVQFQALQNSINDNKAQVMKAIEKMNANQEQVAAITSKLIEFMESSMAQGTSSQKLYALQPVNPRASVASGRSKTCCGCGNTSDCSPTTSTLSETLPATAYTPTGPYPRKQSPNRDKIERGPNEQAYFRELGMRSMHGSQEKVVHPAYRKFRNTR